MPARAPHPALRAYLGPYVGYRDVLDPRAIHYGVAGPDVVVIIAFDDPVDVGWLDRPADRSRYRVLLAGLRTAPSLVRPHGRQHGLQLAIKPLGARQLLRRPAAALAGEIVPGEELAHLVPDRLYAALAAAGWAERFQLLDEHFLALLGDAAAAVTPEVAGAWRLLADSGGGMRVEALASAVGWSRRRLTDRFTGELGLGPKQAARVLRFGRARRLAVAGTPLADVAAATGYADQAHLSREWRALAGDTPSGTIANVYPIVQDAGAGGERG